MTAVVVTCEHATARVPREYAAMARGRRARALLASHRGWDLGALAAARRIARALRAPLLAGEVTRLLVDLNRSRDHRGVFSELSRALPAAARDALLAGYWEPFRAEAEARVRAGIAAAGSALHLSIHSFTPVWRGRVRRADLGLLYDPRRRRERALCAAWRDALRDALPGLSVRRNEPYRGWTDGHGTALRRRLPDARYACVEVELNQRALADPRRARAIADALVATLRPLISPASG